MTNHRHGQRRLFEKMPLKVNRNLELEKDRVVFLLIHGNFGKTYWAGC